MVHIGEKIQEVLKDKGIKQVTLANKLFMSRQNLRSMLFRETIDVERLQRIGEILDHDFFQYYPNKRPPATAAVGEPSKSIFTVEQVLSWWEEEKRERRDREGFYQKELDNKQKELESKQKELDRREADLAIYRRLVEQKYELPA